MLSVRVSPATSAALVNPAPAAAPENARNRLFAGMSSGNRRSIKLQASKGAPPKEMDSGSLTGVVFEPFAEVKHQLTQVPETSSVSFARQRFAPRCEAAINDQINVEYNVSYVYHAMFGYFDRDNVGLPGMARYFKEASEEERGHAEKFMKYQNLRGGKVVLHSILGPSITEFDHAEKGDALYAMELALALEKLTNDKLLALHKVAVDHDDIQMQDFIESEFLGEQVESIKKISVYVSQLRRIGKGHAVYHFDRSLHDGED
ncbi:ferritin-2, chloroplastic [Selaginella moellendorffii]|nr:ferritin-2, chloroplastic [Selaginella moellendorffii]|eukprot:XP_002961565.2 ferritin-2, chloroplastic [Selaginella moellendorffii]